MSDPVNEIQRKPPTWREWKLRRRRRVWALLLAPEWASEWIVYRSRSWDFVRVLELAGKFAILFAALAWFLEADDRIKAKHYRAWELINSARGSTGDGGRKDALRDLNEDGVSLDGAPLAKATLIRLDLPNADLTAADLSGANLSEANLSGAKLFTADLPGAHMFHADLTLANLTGAYLNTANLTGATLFSANLSGADLSRAKLAGADLTFVNMSGANLSGADLSGANLSGADLSGADLSLSLGLNVPSGWELYDDKGKTYARRKASAPP